MFLPIHVESVASIVGRSELLALLFSLLALLSSWKNKYWVTSLWFLLALLSKEVAIAFLPIWVYIELVYKKMSPRTTIKHLLFFVPPVLLYAFMRYLALGSKYFINANGPSFFNPIRNTGIISGFYTALKVLFLYVQKIIFPTYFSSDYSYNQITVAHRFFGSWQTMIGILILTGLLFFVLHSKNNLLRLGCVIFLSSYFVVSNLVFKIGTIMAERLMYLPSLGFALISAEIFSQGFEKKKYKKVVWFIFILLLLIYAVQTIKGNRLWQNEKFLFENAYDKAPNSVVNVTNIASLLFQSGKTEEALKKISEATAIDPKNAPALQIRGQIQMELKLPDQAEESWKMAISSQPDYLYPYLSLGTYYYRKGNFSAGENILLKIPTTAQPLANLITLLSLNKIGLGKYQETINLIKSSFGENPEEKELQFALGLAYLKNESESTAKSFLLKFKDQDISEQQYLKFLKTTKIFPIEI